MKYIYGVWFRCDICGHEARISEDPTYESLMDIVPDGWTSNDFRDKWGQGYRDLCGVCSNKSVTEIFNTIKERGTVNHDLARH